MASESSRPAKLQRLNTFRRGLPFVTQSALAAILDEIHQHGAPELHTRKRMKEATSAHLSQLDAYGSLLTVVDAVCKDGTTKPMLMVNFLYTCMQPSTREVLTQTSY